MTIPLQQQHNHADGRPELAGWTYNHIVHMMCTSLCFHCFDHVSAASYVSLLILTATDLQNLCLKVLRVWHSLAAKEGLALVKIICSNKL